MQSLSLKIDSELHFVLFFWLVLFLFLPDKLYFSEKNQNSESLLFILNLQTCHVN